MSVTVTVKTQKTIELDVETAAEYFAHLNDEAQADFFIKVAEFASRWPGAHDTQWYYVGRHLRTCHCSTEEARDMIRSLARAVGDEAQVEKEAEEASNHQLEQALESAHRYRKIPDSERPVYKMEAVAMLDEIERLSTARSSRIARAITCEARGEKVT